MCFFLGSRTHVSNNYLKNQHIRKYVHENVHDFIIFDILADADLAD